MPAHAELQVTTNYSFLRGASHVEELLLQAKALGLAAIGITDRNTLAGVARAHARALEVGIQLVIGCRLDLQDGLPMLVYPTDRAAYGRLCRLLTLGKGRAGKEGCDLAWADMVAHGDGLLVVLLPDEADDALSGELARLARDFHGRAYLALSLRRRPGDALRLTELSEMADAAGVAPVVMSDVLYHAPERRILQDVVTCIRKGCTIDDAGFRRERYADRHLRPPAETARLFERYPEALARTEEIVRRCPFSLSELRYQYPDELEQADETPQQGLERLVWQHVPGRYPKGLPPDVERQLRHELTLIAQLDYASYFLTVHAIVRYARSRDILCQGRGSAANSAVSYVLGVTSIDPVRSGPAVQTLRLRRARRAARHRRRFRERPPRGGHPVGLRPLRPRSRRTVRHRHALSLARRHTRRRQGARALRGCLRPLRAAGVRSPDQQVGRFYKADWPNCWMPRQLRVQGPVPTYRRAT